MKAAPWIIILVLLLLFIIQREFLSSPDCPELTSFVSIKEVKGDSVPKPYPVFIIKRVDSIVYDTIYPGIDTSAILADYFAKIYGNDTLANDSSVFVSIQYMVTHNRLIWVLPSIANRRASVTNTVQNTINPPVLKTSFYAGVGVGRSPTEFGLTANLYMISKQNHGYGLSFDPINRDVYFTMLWQIR